MAKTLKIYWAGGASQRRKTGLLVLPGGEALEFTIFDDQPWEHEAYIAFEDRILDKAAMITQGREARKYRQMIDIRYYQKPIRSYPVSEGDIVEFYIGDEDEPDNTHNRLVGRYQVQDAALVQLHQPLKFKKRMSYDEMLNRKSEDRSY